MIAAGNHVGLKFAALCNTLAGNSPPDCCISWFEPSPPYKKTDAKWRLFFGAGDEARTRYLHLGKVALYRMSYTRINKMHYTKVSLNVKHYFCFFALMIHRRDKLNNPTHSPSSAYRYA